MTFAIIIRGPLGIGKTTIARMLAQELRAAYFSVDELLNQHGLETVEKKCIPIKNFLLANEFILEKMKQSRKKNVVIDGNFYHREQIEHLRTHLGDSLRVFTLTASLATCIARDSGRDRRYGEDAARAVYALVTRFNDGTVIDTEEKTQDEIVQTIRNHFHNKE